MTRILLLLLISVCVYSATGQPVITKKIKKTLALVDTMQIRERIIYLSDDKLKGRKPGTEGYQMAVDYAIGQFKKLGIEPKGDEGYLQKVILRTASVDSASSSFYLNGQKLSLGKQAIVWPDMNRASSSAEAELVWVGYGISAPHLGYDDYTNVSVEGKIVVLKGGTPADFPASEKAHFNGLANKGDIAGRKGAIGMIVLESSDQAFAFSVMNAVAGFNGFVNKDGSAGSGRMSVHPNLKFNATIKAALLKEAIGSTQSPSKPLGVTVRVNSSSRYRDLISYNVIGWIPGKDPVLKNEFVIHTAHLDHVGIGRPIKGDSIYNGAHDNASGTSCAIEIAKLYKNASTRRSVLIALVTAEEMGLLGSRYLAANPPVPKGQIVADVNTDMPTLIAPLLSIEPLGAKHSSLMNEVTSAAQFLGLEVQEDHMPDQVRFVRSDQYSFLREGIPALHVKYGLKTKDPKFDLRKYIDEWTEAHYHKPSDEFRDSAFNFGAAATYVKLNFLIGWQVANKTERPTWVKGDFFGETFSKK
ncbi:MAG: M28 family peptidase [Cyclobacteriaceae bacterium]